MNYAKGTELTQLERGHARILWTMRELMMWIRHHRHGHVVRPWLHRVRWSSIPSARVMRWKDEPSEGNVSLEAESEDRGHELSLGRVRAAQLANYIMQSNFS
jgi:hypothetical protein